MLLHNDIGICEDHANDLDNDGFKGCVACLLFGEIRRLEEVIKKLKSASEPPNKSINADPATVCNYAATGSLSCDCPNCIKQ